MAVQMLERPAQTPPALRMENLLAGPADLAVEVVSPNSRGRDRGAKYYEYEQGG